MRRHWNLASWLLSLSLSGAFFGTLPAVAVETADVPAAAELLPPSTVGFVEIVPIPQIFETILDHPLRQKLESLDPVKAAYEKKEFLDFKAGVAAVESQLGLPWRKIITKVMGDGAFVAIDAKTQGLAIMLRAQDETTQTKLVETLANLAKLDAVTKGKTDPVKTAEYRGVKGYAIDKTNMVILGRWMVLSNKNELVKWIADCYLDRPAETLASNGVFQQARSAKPANEIAWGWLNAAVLREAGVAKELYKGQADNALAELLFGGILSTLKHTSSITASLNAGDQRATLTLTAQHDRSWAGETREYYFGKDGGGTAPASLTVKNAILSLQAYRDISGMWMRAGDLFDENANEELAKADSNLSTLFGGKDFGEDILGSFAPQMQLIVAQQDFPPGKPQPAIKLPTFAFVFQLKDREKMQPELRRTFQSLIGFLNIVGAMNGQPQLDQGMEKIGDVQLVTSNYLMDAKQKDPTGLKLQYNFSPSIGFSGDRIVIASTQELARELALAKPTDTSPGQEQSKSKAVTINTAMALNFDLIRSALEDNRGQLVAQNMLKEGHTKEEAEKEIGLVLELIGWLDSAMLQLGTTEKELQLSLSVGLKKA